MQITNNQEKISEECFLTALDPVIQLLPPHLDSMLQLLADLLFASALIIYEKGIVSHHRTDTV
jgi:hypothetical protein